MSSLNKDIKNLWQWEHVINPLLSDKWLAYFNSVEKIFVGFSGGLDSTALLHSLVSYPLIKSKITAVHINHGLSQFAPVWQNHCTKICQDFDIPILTRLVQFNRKSNIEEGARIARYHVFAELIKPNHSLVLGHHQDDQAETLLLQLLRGAGIDGLSAMSELSSFSQGSLTRPLLSVSRKLLEDYVRFYRLSLIDDESNQNIHYSRNYLRHEIIPLLAKKWPGAVGNISRAAAHCQQAKTNLALLGSQDIAASLDTNTNILSLTQLKEYSPARLVNALRFWLHLNHIPHPNEKTFNRIVQELIFARVDAVSEVSWGKIAVRRYQHNLYLETKKKKKKVTYKEWINFPKPLVINELGINLFAEKANDGFSIPAHAKVVISFRQGGEQLIWHGQTKQLKKLFQEWRVPFWLRDQIPLVYINGELAAIIGYAISDLFYVKNTPSWSLSFSTINH